MKLIFALFVCLISSIQNSFTRDGSVHFEINKLDLGVIDRQISERDYVFYLVLINSTSTAARIKKITTSCGCFRGEALAPIIPSQGRTKLKVTMDRLSAISDQDYIIACEFQDGLVLTATFKMTLYDRVRVSNKSPHSIVVDGEIISGNKIELVRTFISRPEAHLQEELPKVTTMKDASVDFEVSSRKFAEAISGDKKYIEVIYSITPRVVGKRNYPFIANVSFSWKDRTFIEVPWRFDRESKYSLQLTALMPLVGNDGKKVILSLRAYKSCVIKEVIIKNKAFDKFEVKDVGSLNDQRYYSIILNIDNSLVSDVKDALIPVDVKISDDLGVSLISASSL